MASTELRLLGYWSDGERSRWPSVELFVDPEWDVEERELIVEYLQRGFVARSYMGYSPCRVCGQPNGALELSDRTFVWPDGFAHYVREHGVKPPQDFIEHARSQLDVLEGGLRNEEWWAAAGRSQQKVLDGQNRAEGGCNADPETAPEWS